MKYKLAEWLRRYLPAELIAILTTAVAASLTYHISHSYVLAAGAGTGGENIGYYGYFIVREVLQHHKTHRHHRTIRRIALVATKTIRNLLLEFGPAETIDLLVARPFSLYFFSQHIKPYAIGILAGKLAADVIFYSIAICSYEANKRWLPNKPKGHELSGHELVRDTE